MGGRGALRGLKYVHSFRDRFGQMRHYFRRNGRRTPLPGIPGSEEFMAAYGAALAATQPIKPELRRVAGRLSFLALAERYYGSPNFKALSEGSQRNYRRVIDQFLEEHGSRRIDQMTRQHVDVLIGRKRNMPGAGIILLKRLRTLCRYAIEIGWIDRDPTAGARSYRSVEIHTWTEEEIDTYERKWPTGSRERLAFALLLYTGQRGSDVQRMVWNDVSGDTIRITQQKTHAHLIIPIHSALQTELSLATQKHACILTTAFGASFSVKGLGNMMSRAIAAAGLPARCKAHGLRKAAARRLAEAGCSAKEIGAVTGHRTLAEIERYTRAADQEALARQAIKKQGENRSDKPYASRVTNRS